jgi:GNAT superfamily N-acetyltransferase
VSVLRIAQAERADLPAVAGMFAATLADDPVFAQIVPPGPQRPETLRAFFEVYVRSSIGEGRALDLAIDGDRIIGAAAWSFRAAGAYSPFEHTALVLGYVKALGVGRLIPPYQLWQRIEQRRPHSAPGWLSPSGVVAARRDAGVGSALVQHRLALADADGVEAYAESSTPADRRFLERLGFLGGTDRRGRPTASLHRLPARAITRHD